MGSGGLGFRQETLSALEPSPPKWLSVSFVGVYTKQKSLNPKSSTLSPQPLKHRCTLSPQTAKLAVSPEARRLWVSFPQGLGFKGLGFRLQSGFRIYGSGLKFRGPGLGT